MSNAEQSLTRILNFGEVADVFQGHTDFSLNWLFLGGSGLHGTGLKVKDILKLGLPNEITVMIVQHRRVNIKYGHIAVLDVHQLNRLAEWNRKTLEYMAKELADLYHD